VDAPSSCRDTTTLGCLTFLAATFFGALGGWTVGVFIGMQVDAKSVQPFQTAPLGALIGAGADLTVALAVTHRSMNRLARALIVLSGVCLVAPVFAWFFAYLLPLGRPKPFEQAAFDRVVAEIRRGALQPDHEGVVTLPKDLASLSATRRVYVTRSPGGRLIVFFPSWAGRDTLLINLADCSGDNWLQGYIYDSRPWGYKPSGSEVDKDNYPGVLGPPPEPSWKAVHDGRAEPRILCNQEKLTEHWSYADIFS